ncbi:MAG: hypothetical protein RLO52_34670 [Sandaracinaceae bacterium]|nr:MAG: hypothetical protein EVA89_32145 [Sandaracinaceae bacterium]
MLLDRIIKKWRKGDAPRDVRVKRAPADPETTADLVDHFFDEPGHDGFEPIRRRRVGEDTEPVF